MIDAKGFSLIQKRELLKNHDRVKFDLGNFLAFKDIETLVDPYCIEKEPIPDEYDPMYLYVLDVNERIDVFREKVKLHNEYISSLVEKEHETKAKQLSLF
tara:strand:- start:294 stop:593 length:300 start_codon:yes stop_codon:yes gene_type:complete